MYCIGLVVFMYCSQPEPIQTVDSFCLQTKEELRSLQLTENEVVNLQETNVDKLLSLKEKYKRLCIEKEEIK